MASSKRYLEFILGQLSDLPEIAHQAMMGEYVIGSIYDDRFLIKSVESAKRLMSEACFELPYEGVRKILLVDAVDDTAFLQQLFEAMYEELPVPKKRKIDFWEAAQYHMEFWLQENSDLTALGCWLSSTKAVSDTGRVRNGFCIS